jgi:hypothetical protein
MKTHIPIFISNNDAVHIDGNPTGKNNAAIDPSLLGDFLVIDKS